MDDTRSETTDDSIQELIFKRRYSFPIDGLEEDVVDPVFEQTVDEIRQAIKDEKYKDNCYADPMPETLHRIPAKRKKMVNRKCPGLLG